MIPNNAATVIVFFLLVAPGIVFQMLRARWRPAVTESVFRETSRILLASTACTLLAIMALSILRLTWPSSMPDPGAWLRDGQSYFLSHYRLVARSVLLAVLLSFGIAALASWLMSRKAKGELRPVSTWFQLFRVRVPEDARPYVRVRLKSGEVYGGSVIDYSEDVALADRELVLGPPLSRRVESEETTVLDDAWQRVVIAGADIEVMWVSYVRRRAAPGQQKPTS
jgi:Family of unknown function (DUF6338)